MGVCGSKPKGCVGMKGKLNLQKTRRKHRTRRIKKAHSSVSKNRVEPSDPKDRSFNNPAYQGNSDSWFDTDGVIESDGDDEFYSIQDDISQAGSLSNIVTPRFANQVPCANNIDSQPICDDPQTEVKNSALLDKSSAQVEGETINCGFISNALLPCIACDESLEGKKKSALLGANAKPIIQRPIAGSQVLCSPLEKKTSESWSRIDPNNFKVRGRNYTKDKKKEFAPNMSAYVPFGVDIFLSSRKITHVARHVELPAIYSHEEIPPILIVNLQIPLYPAAIFQNEYDGPGMSLVFYFKVSENYTELPVHFRENIKRIIANETEKIKGFPMDTNAPYRERLKILGRVVNFEDLQLSSAERKLMHAYNEKPVLTRPQHEFYSGENYFEIDLDIHRFSYIARKGFETFQDRIKNCVFDFGLTIQGTKVEDLPECMLCCLRLKEIDYTKYCQLSF
ncbi:hypothetical protein STAS_12086 [Striga asiatica]|uniref:Protein ENHANCED DISEASE RESISTANCE 2 C-terminal domain-containing protein n=1 Tax=Striga asiatica TaxID=4170 RepID=A0A5A7PTE8_STRAF|nr:hypothetical protein STAS_12086 [Striga asiatica]